MNSFKLYHKWIVLLEQLSPVRCVGRVANGALLLIGMSQAQQVRAGPIVRHSNGRARQTSLTWHLSLFLPNLTERLRGWYVSTPMPVGPGGSWARSAACKVGVDNTLRVPILYLRRIYPTRI
jgi:hypothetical protein